MRAAQAMLRSFWRSLTSMRIALILLLLLALAAIPGSLLPQRSVNADAVNAYLRAHPGSGPTLDQLSFFDVYSSPWFSAIYLLLFISLVGCLVPRLRQHARNIVAKPPAAPARLNRLPHTTQRTADGPPAEVADALRLALRRRRWRAVVRQADGAVTVSAEKGYVKESGNLVFHFALLALLVGVAVGSWYGWHGNRVVVAGADSGFCNTLSQYDEYGLGARTAGSDLPPFCVNLDSFTAQYLDNGQPIQYTAQVSYVEGNGAVKPWRLEVNEPLRLNGANVYLLGHGYSPIIRYTDRYGVSHTADAPFLPEDSNLTSTGVLKFPYANVDPTGKATPTASAQMAFAGVYLPTMPDVADGNLSAFPGERNPGLVLSAYEGNLGLDSGFPQSVYTLDQRQIATGALKKVAESKLLKPGESWQLPDGSTVEFVGTKQWISVSVRYDPGETVVLIGAGSLLVGLMVSLFGRRRRIWARVTADGDGRSLISLGGLPRSDYPGFADEFAHVADLVGTPKDDARQPVAVGEKGP